MRHIRVVALIALAASLSACEWYGLTGTTGGSSTNPYEPCTSYCTDLAITPIGQNLLVGDDMKLYGYTNRVYPASIEWTALTQNVLLTSGAISGKTVTEAPGYDLTVKATAVGPAKLTAKVVGTTYTADYPFFVSDSASMTSLRIVVLTPTVKVSQSLYLNGTLKDADGIQYRGAPSWTSTDVSVARVSADTYSRGGASVAGVKAGTAKIIASFRNLRDTLVVTVVP